MMRLLPPSGMPISLSRIIGASTAAIFADSSERFIKQVKEVTGARHCDLVNSARTGLSLILKALAESSERQGREEVIIPAYTCYSVAAAVVRAGLKIRTVDIDPDSFDFDQTKLAKTDFERVLAIIPSSLFGLVADFDQLRRLTGASNSAIIDDAAQAFGSGQGDRSAGSLGDAGVISLDRGKNLTTYSGGLILTDNDQLSDLIKVESERLPSASVGSNLSTALKALIYSLLIRPTLFRLPASLPFLGLGETIYDASFPMSRLGSFQSALGQRMISDLAGFNKHRMVTGLKLAERIRKMDQYRIPKKITDRTTPLRLPVMARNGDHRARVIAALRRAGVVASNMYPSIISAIPDLSKHLVSGLAVNAEAYPGATSVVEKMFTLPTHPFVSASDIDRMVNTLAGVEA